MDVRLAEALRGARVTTRRRTRFPNIVRDPWIVGGEPTIRGTRIPVRSVVLIHNENGFEYTCEAFPSASPEQLQEALEFYREHREEIDRYIGENEAAAHAVHDGPDESHEPPSRPTRPIMGG